MNTDRLWVRFVELLSLDLHDGDAKLVKERPCKNMHGAISAYKKFFDQAVTDLNEEYRKLRERPADPVDPRDRATEVGFCGGCGHNIEVGDPITWWGWVDYEQTKRKFVHKKCPTKFDIGGEG